MLASLNHPNIASIYGLEESNGTHFLVLELVEGDTLADRIKAGPIPVEDALKLALQISEALEAAHEKGVIHRDLKPANIKVTPDGKAKVLDFGLAKAYAGEQGEMILSDSPTLSVAATQQGIILGTAAYMSPEQAKGKSVDKRADVWAFGVVLFEMLTGRSVFAADDVSQTLARVLEREPDFSTLPQNLHPKIIEMLERCLEKEVNNRYGSISDARVDIQKVLADPSGIFVQPVMTAEPETRLRTMVPWIAAAVVITAIIAGVAVWKLKPTEPHQVMRFDYELPDGQQLADSLLSLLAISPDGKRFVYCSTEGLCLRSADELTSKIILGTQTALEPCFSPDGEWICYWSGKDNQLKKIALSGGAPVSIAKLQRIPGGLTWSAGNMIVYGATGGIMRVSTDGGTPEALVESDAQCFDPQILADEQLLLYTLGSAPNKVVVHSLKSGKSKELFAGGAARYVPTGHIIYVSENTLFARPFDLDRLEAVGGPIPMVEGVFGVGSQTQYAVSDSGMLVYAAGTLNSLLSGTTMVWVDREGKEQVLAASPSGVFPNISPDGRSVAFTVGVPSNSDIWIWDLIRKNPIRLTFDEVHSGVPLWTTDGKRIVYFSNREGDFRVYWQAADGTGKPESLISSPPRSRLVPWSWSDHGNILILEEKYESEDYNIGMMLMDRGKREWKPLLQEEYAERHPRISPDGQWMAYTSDQSGINEVYVRPFPNVDEGRWKVSTSGGDSPLWSPDGRELFYRNDDSVMAVTIAAGSTFRPETLRILFRGTYVSAGSGAGPSWNISPDGKLFLMIKPAQSEGTGTEMKPQKLVVVLNWLEELKQRVPVD